jgi:adenylate cyclase
VQAYAGPLLAGFPHMEEDFADWLAPSRAELERKVLAVLARIGDLCTATGDAAGALEAAERMFAIDPLREEIHCRLLESCGAAGRRAEGLRHYAAITEALKRELGITPGADLRAVAQRLRAEMDPPARATVDPPLRSAPPPIAVLPFAQLSEETVPAHIADGILVDTVCQLAGLRELQVISHGSTLRYRDPQVDLRQIGRELGVRYVVRGAMRRRGNALRLTTELADAATGAVVWARTHDTVATLDFADQDQLVAHIVTSLAPRVQELELRRIRGQRPDSLSVYEKVLLARQHMLLRTQEGYQEAWQLLEDAMRREPDYAEAHALAADWHGYSIAEGFSSDRRWSVGQTEHYISTALSLDHDNVRALSYGAHWRALFQRDYARAKDMFERTAEIAPCSAPAWLWSSYTYSYTDEGDVAVERAQRALALSPVDQNAHDFLAALCIAHYSAGNFDEAAIWGRRALAAPPLLLATIRWTAASLAAAGRHKEAREVAAEGLRVSPGQWVSKLVANSPFVNPTKREAYGQHLLAAGLPP